MRTLGFGIIGGGLMGREFVSAAARWFHLLDADFRPEIRAVCDRNPDVLAWYRERAPTIPLLTGDWRELLADPTVEAVYCAVPHHLHEEIYTGVLKAGKHLLGEKPFGIDLRANEAILAAACERPDRLVRCSSEFPFYPAVQRIGRMIEAEAFGPLLEVHADFRHSSDLDPDKPINWKRMVAFNGEYGCMGDLGMHVCHVPFRAGWFPRNVRAILSKMVRTRPDGKGQRVPCETWDNATLLCEAVDPLTGNSFPLTFRTQRIAPGETNSWNLEILGMKACARFSTKNPRRLELLEYRPGSEQAWKSMDLGNEMAFRTLTGSIFEVGFSDVLMQMFAAFMHEWVHGRPLHRFAGCVTPEETHWSHRLFTAALESHRRSATVPV
jgi:predicted dehydrogenase